VRWIALPFLLLPSLAFAWSGDGHQIVALVAEERLTPETKAAIRDLIGNDTNISDAEFCMYADNIRRERRETATWNYVNIDIKYPANDLARDGTLP
jgi:hypothetical protein